MSARFLTRNQVAAELGISPWSVYRLIRIGELRGMRLGSMWRISVEDLAAYRDSNPPKREATGRAAPKGEHPSHP